MAGKEGAAIGARHTFGRRDRLVGFIEEACRSSSGQTFQGGPSSLREVAAQLERTPLDSRRTR